METRNMRYKIGDKVLFRGRIGYIVDLVNPENDKNYRYHVSCMGQLWSVAEHEIHQPNRFKSNNTDKTSRD